jgi:peptidyl-prolyl cis-trans isomerase SurA
MNCQELRKAGRMVALAMAGVLLAMPAAALDVQRIAATVNDEVISLYDVEQRLRLIVASTQARYSEDALQRLREQVLRTLIDERLKLQESRRVEITVERAEIQEVLEDIAMRNNMRVGQIKDQLAQDGIEMATLERQIEADLAWQRLVQARFAPRVSVTEDEVNNVLERMRANADQPQYHLSEIFLPVDSPERDEEVRRQAMQILEQMGQGASFPALAANFSQSASASAAGDIGWVRDSELPQEIAEALRQLRPGQISLPIRTVAGYYIMALRDRRISEAHDDSEVTMTLKQVVVPLVADDEETFQRAGALAYQISEGIPGCDAVNDLPRQIPVLRVGDIGTVSLHDLSERFAAAVRPLMPGEATEPLPSPSGFHVLVVCDRQGDRVSLPSRDEIEDRLLNQQINVMARRWLRDLRRDATIEERL